MEYSVICWNLRTRNFEVVKSGLPLVRAKQYADAIKREKIPVICLDSEAHEVLIDRAKIGYHGFYSETLRSESRIVRPESAEYTDDEELEDTHEDDYTGDEENNSGAEFQQYPETVPGTFPYEVVTIGSGPYQENIFDHLLLQKGIRVFRSGSEDVSVLIIGRDEWSEAEINDHLELYAGKHLKVYSQEMFLAFMAIGLDPYGDRNLLMEFGQGHPALEYLSESGFDWVNTQIIPSKWSAEVGDLDLWPKQSPLKLMGYTVGTNGLAEGARRRILNSAFKGDLPKAHSLEYMEKWGEPKTSGRLQQIAKEIASFVKLHKRQRTPPLAAIEHWEEDLDWLKAEFYHGGYRFSWPSTYVRR